MIKIGAKLKELRSGKQLTQKELAEQLNVSAQAVSRWENDEVEPSLETLGQLTTIFGISMDELFGKAPVEAPTPVAAQPSPAPVTAPQEESLPVLGVCEDCRKPLYHRQDIEQVRHTDAPATVLCISCHAKRQVRSHTLEREELLEDRNHAFVWGAIAGIAALIVSLLVCLAGAEKRPQLIAPLAVSSVLLFTFLFCVIVDNNFVGEMWTAVAAWGCVKMPGVIFTLDFDGLLFLIAAKILFGIIGFLCAAAGFVLATALGFICSIFVFPFALGINIREAREETAEISSWTRKITSARR